MPLSVGTQIGPYQILSAIGAGGMGEVYRAKDTRLKRDVALKVLPEAFANDGERLARITREAEVLASLNHPNIATIYGVEERALVMELVEGEPPKGPMSFELAWKIGSQIVDALEYAHEKGIVHRDLKPANVKVTAEGTVKLLDFGLAKAFTEPTAQGASPEHSPTLTIGATQVGVILGTAAYMSPEQAKGKSVDRRADIWAFGVMMYELLTGQRLFKGEDISDTLAQVLTKEPELSHVPARAQKLLRRCLEKDPKKRLRDIGETRHYIDEPAAPAPRAGKPRLPWAIAGTALVLAAAAYWLRPSREEPVIRSFILAPEQSSFRCQGDDAAPAVLSPDGKRLAFAAAAPDGKILLWVRPLDSATAQPLAGTEGTMFPFWSPNSRSLGFFADGKLKKIEATGGTVGVLADAPFTRGGAWNQDGVILFSPGLSSVLMRIPASGGAATPVTHLDEKLQEISHRWPAFLPDGKHFLYTSRGRGIFVASLDVAEAPRRLLDENSNVLYSQGSLLYTHDNTLMVRPFDVHRREFIGPAVMIGQSVQADLSSNRACFTASDNGLVAYHFWRGESQLTWFDRAGNRMGTVGAPELFRGIEIAPDGKQAAAILSNGSGGESVWIYELSRGIKARFASSTASCTGAVWSPDASRVAVGLQRDGSYIIFAKQVGGSGSEDLLFRSSYETVPEKWLAQVGLVLMLRNPKTGWDISYLPLLEKGRDRTPVPVLRDDANDVYGAVSPDGRWVLYASDASGGAVWEAYVASFPGGGNKRQVSTTGADAVRWSPNGQEIFFASRTKLMAAEVRSSAGTLEVGTPHVLFEMRGDCATSEIPCFDVAPDGKRFLVVEPTGARPPVALIQNWTAALKK
jgi:Tol biopolymer transport system component